MWFDEGSTGNYCMENLISDVLTRFFQLFLLAECLLLMTLQNVVTKSAVSFGAINVDENTYPACLSASSSPWTPPVIHNNLTICWAILVFMVITYYFVVYTTIHHFRPSCVPHNLNRGSGFSAMGLRCRCHHYRILDPSAMRNICASHIQGYYHFLMC